MLLNVTLLYHQISTEHGWVSADGNKLYVLSPNSTPICNIIQVSANDCAPLILFHEMVGHIVLDQAYFGWHTLWGIKFLDFG